MFLIIQLIMSFVLLAGTAAGLVYNYIHDIPTTVYWILTAGASYLFCLSADEVYQHIKNSDR